ncbi:MAG: NADH-quinone oxidoreductase subunit C [Nitrospiria bacterium]
MTLGELSLIIAKEGILPLCRYLHDDPEMLFDHITDICSLDFPEDEERFVIVYHFYSIPKNHRIRLKTRVSEEECFADSITSIWKGANFMEREVYDMMGIRFNHHPDLRRIMLPEDFEGYPLRKDFPTEGRGWRSTFEFLPGN